MGLENLKPNEEARKAYLLEKNKIIKKSVNKGMFDESPSFQKQKALKALAKAKELEAEKLKKPPKGYKWVTVEGPIRVKKLTLQKIKRNG